MSEITHDPSEYVRGLKQLLVSDKKRIAFLFGAGTSLAKKNTDSINVPAIGEMTKKVEDVLSKDSKYSKAISEIKKELKANNVVYNIETLLSNIEQKLQILGNGTLNGLNKDEFKTLKNKIKSQIRIIVSVHEKVIVEKKITDLLHFDFAEWVGRANRKYPIEIFTTNYDYLFELGLEEKSIPYYDGFTGSYKPFFNADSVEDMCFAPNQTKLWKVHGSLGWHFNWENKKVLRKDSDSDDILIYPSFLKYNESRKQPYTALLDRLTNYLKQPDTILITCGYSFGDEHINERIITALNSNSKSHVYALYYDAQWKDDKFSGYELNDDSSFAKLAKSNSKLTVFGCRSAVMGGQLGPWKLKREPDSINKNDIKLYFEEDPKKVDSKTGEESWAGTGSLKLTDFKYFVNFLESMLFEFNMHGDEKE